MEGKRMTSEKTSHPLNLVPANLFRPQQFAAFLPRVTPADRRSTPPLRLEFRRQAQQVVTALGQQVAREVRLMQPLHDHNLMTTGQIVQTRSHGAVPPFPGGAAFVIRSPLIPQMRITPPHLTAALASAR